MPIISRPDSPRTVDSALFNPSDGSLGGELPFLGLTTRSDAPSQPGEDPSHSNLNTDSVPFAIPTLTIPSPPGMDPEFTGGGGPPTTAAVIPTSPTDAATSTGSDESPTAAATSAQVNGDNPDAVIPVWGVVIIVITGLVALAFLISLIVFSIRERRRKNEGGDKNPSYPRAAGKALAASTGVFIPMWAFRKARKTGEKGQVAKEQKTAAYYKHVSAYEDLDHDQAQELRDQERRMNDPMAMRRESEFEADGMRAHRLAPLNTTAMPPPRRSASLVSSLSSGSQGEYERLGEDTVVPSPVTEDIPYPWKSQERLDARTSESEDRRHVTEVEPRMEPVHPAILRPGSMIGRGAPGV
ncbi:hypothetical protein M426DRAFT_316533 [Hypoxylon sp. CI-4A]|nr:hypothetical protein M426DRAFT_316533 [Hypoxylon sp. CI-4A]